MIRKLSASFPVVLLAVLAALTWWLDRSVQPLPPARDGSSRHDPDYIVDNLVAVRLGPDGKRLHELAAKRMTHYPDDDTTHLESPTFVRYAPDRPQLSITSERALVSSQGDQVYFTDNVRAVRAAIAGRGELILSTDYLEVTPDDQYARTQRPVQIRDANSQVSAVGLELDGKAQTIQLFSNVRGTYVRPK